MPALSHNDLRVEQLFSSLRVKRLGSVERMLADGAPPNARNRNDLCALSVAAEVGFLEGAQALIAAGANVNQRDYTHRINKSLQTTYYYQTPLGCAIQGRNLEVAELLLDAGADPRLTNEREWNAAHLAIAVGLVNADVDGATTERNLTIFARLLAPAGAINKLDYEGKTPLQRALDAKANTHPAAIDLLLAHGADVNRMADGLQAVHREWNDSNLWLLRKLVEHGADISARDWRGASPLSYSSDEGAVMTILDLGGDVNHLDDLGRNALAAALDLNSGSRVTTKAAACLIAAGIDTAHRDYTGTSAESRLANLDRAGSAELLALVRARKAREAMTRTATSSAPRRNYGD